MSQDTILFSPKCGVTAGAKAMCFVTSAVVAVHVIITAKSNAAPGEFPQGARMVALPLYGSNSPQAIAVWRAGRVTEDYERRGFFRIGVLPILALEDLSLEVSDPGQLSLVLKRASACLARVSEAKRVVDGRRFSIVFASETNSWIRARQLRAENQARWRLDDVTVARPGTPPLLLRRAFLHVGGPQTGELHGETPEGTISIPLAAFISNAGNRHTSP